MTLTLWKKDIPRYFAWIKEKLFGIFWNIKDFQGMDLQWYALLINWISSKEKNFNNVSLQLHMLF